MESRVAVFTLRETREGEIRGEIESPYIPAAVVSGDVEETGEGLMFYITQVELFTAWDNGWTEGILEGSGSFLLTPEEGGWTITMQDSLSLWDVVSGGIRYFDTYYRGEDGLRKVKNRVDRMREVNWYLRDEQDFLPFYGDFIETSSYGAGFAADLVPFLFPEAEKRIRRRDRKRMFTEANEVFIASRESETLGAGIYWRTGYSEAILPEHLIPLRNSGTLWRDWEEAGQLFYSLYNMNYLFNTLLNGSVLTEK
jgi:hypothetical protein